LRVFPPGNVGLQFCRVEKSPDTCGAMFLVPFLGNQRRAHLGLTCDNEFLESRRGRRDRAVELGDLGACETNCVLLLSSSEGAFERPKALMGGWQLPRRGQLRVGEAHHHLSDPIGGAQEQGPPFTVELVAFWVCLGPRYLIASLFWVGRRTWGRACFKRFCKRQADRRHLPDA
jgi:hypothetical protein